MNNRSNEIGQTLAYQLNYLLSDSGFYIPARGWADITNLIDNFDDTTGFDCFWITCDWSGSNTMFSYYKDLFESSDDLSLYSLSNYLTENAINDSSSVIIKNDFQVIVFGKFFGCNLNNDTYCNFGYNYLSDDLQLLTQQNDIYKSIVADSYFDEIINRNISYQSNTKVTLLMPLIFQFDPNAFDNSSSDDYNQTKFDKAKDFCSNFTQKYLAPMFEDIASWLGNDEYQFVESYSYVFGWFLCIFLHLCARS